MFIRKIWFPENIVFSMAFPDSISEKPQILAKICSIPQFYVDMVGVLR